MKILFVHNKYHSNLFSWFRGFKENGHEIDLLVYKSDDFNMEGLPTSNYLKPSKGSLKKMSKATRTRGDGVDSFSPYYYPSIKDLFSYFKLNRPDLVVIRPAFSRFSLRVIICSILFGTKKVFYSQLRIHRPYSLKKRLAFNGLMWLLKAHWISPVLGNKKEYLTKPKRLIFLPFTMKPKLKEDRQYLQNEEIKLLSVAKYFTSKNPRLVLDVFLRLCEEYDHVRLTIVGSGDELGEYYKETVQVVRNSAYEDRIELLINRSRNEVEELYLSHDIFILPSRYDPAAITNVEAMAHGMPVICSNANGTANYTEHGINGFIFDPSDPTELRFYLEKMINDPQLVKKMGEKSLLSLKSKHDPKDVTSKFLSQIV